MICDRCRERIPDDADVIEDETGANVCPECFDQQLREIEESTEVCE